MTTATYRWYNGVWRATEEIWLMRTHSICTGESGLPRPFSTEEYKKDCDPEFLTTFVCGWYGVEEPALKRNPEPVEEYKFAGRYWHHTKTVSFNRNYQGLILHELAHYIVDALHLNGTGQCHTPEFWRILQEMIDIWR